MKKEEIIINDYYRKISICFPNLVCGDTYDNPSKMIKI